MQNNSATWTQVVQRPFQWVKKQPLDQEKTPRAPHPFWVMVQKEVGDHIRNWRFIILLAVMVLACTGSLYTGLSYLKNSVKPNDLENGFFFLQLLTTSDGTIPSFMVFISFLGPILGIAMGFDAINGEQSKGTLSRILAQPIHRDYLINAKFVAALIVISVLLGALGLMVMGVGIWVTGLLPSLAEFLRLMCFLLVSVVYVAFWLNLSILFSIRFKQAATAAIAGISVWLFFSVFYALIAKMLARLLTPNSLLPEQKLFQYQQLTRKFMQITPSQLYSDATTTLLMPKVRSLGPLTVEQLYGSLPTPLPLGQSLLIVWPQLIGLFAASITCFALSYALFMRKEIRAH